MLFWKHFAVRPYISTRTREAQDVAFHPEFTWMGKECSVRGLVAGVGILRSEQVSVHREILLRLLAPAGYRT